MATAIKDALQLVAELGEAWNARNVEKILTLFTEDGVWEASWGQQYAGKDEIRRGLAQLFGNVPDVRFVGAKRFASGDNVVSEWRVVGTRPDGTKIDDEAMVHIRKMGRLAMLSLEETCVTDAALEELKQMPNLRTLHLMGTKISRDAVRKFTKSLPKCAVGWP